MGMRGLFDIREMLCDEVDTIAQKGTLTAGDLDTAHKLTDTIKNIDKIARYAEEGYSSAGEWNAGGSYGHSYRDGDMSYRRDSMGRYSRRMYSRDDGKERMIHEMEEMMRNAGNDREREAMRRAVEELRKA